MIGPADFLLRFLEDEGLLDAEHSGVVAQRAKDDGCSVEEALEREQVASQRDIALAKASLMEAPFVDLEHYSIDINNASLVSRSVAEGCVAFPLFVSDTVATVGMSDPMDLGAIDRLRQVLRREIDAVVCERTALERIIGQAYALTDTGVETRTGEQVELTTGDEPIVKAVNQILEDAVDTGASDIHISPTEREVQLRHRIDGRLRERQGPPLNTQTAIVQRLKVMGKLDLTQTRRPQDGKFRFTHRGQQIEVRLSTIPTVAGENVVMRLLRPNAEILDFAQLGIRDDDRAKLERMLEKPHGLMLVTGPTGSGKTSTLFAGLHRLNQPDRNVMTIEDPVEIRLEGVRQVQTNSEIGLTFASALRSILRQDPDVVLVGEIRDEETATIALQASLTGHLVLSTLHTNDAPSAIARLRDLGVPPFVIASALVGAIGQRLVRRVCDGCTTPDTPEAHLVERFGLDPTKDRFVTGAGCPRCAGTGYRGRVGVYEIAEMTTALGEAIDRDATTREITRVALEEGMRPMWRDGVDKARLGLTSLSEIVRIGATMVGVGEHEDPLGGRVAA
ncbi:MAG: GspE/PulE family protein [Phycisphaerales bacterium]